MPVFFSLRPDTIAVFKIDSKIFDCFSLKLINHSTMNVGPELWPFNTESKSELS